MRYFLPIWILIVAVSIGVLGFRESVLRKPPIEVFPDMDRQMKFRPQVPNEFFRDNRASRLPASGTVARSEPRRNVAGGAVVYSYEDHPVNSGKMTGTTNWVELNPTVIDAQSMARGRQRFEINCLPCHGPLGDGNGVTKKLGMAVVATLHDPRIVKMSDGELFHVISNGRNLMGPYASQLAVEDRWAVISYLRALQFSRLGSLEDVPAQFRASLNK
ncbi:MAG: cytochrome c [Pedosphaera sp.]|nr:cytochrome c [Pedosphaera sp.]